jgi:hypothetical protein
LFYKCIHVLSVQSTTRFQVTDPVSDILKRKSKYLANENVQKFRFGNKSKHDDLNDLMWDWFRQACDKTIPLSGPILIDLIFFTRLTMECKRSVQHI